MSDLEELERTLGSDPLMPLHKRKRISRKPGEYKTHCKYGHPMSGDNLIVRKDWRRRCKACVAKLKEAWAKNNPSYAREYSKAYAAAQRARTKELEAALRDVLPYCPDFMHGLPKKHYLQIAHPKD